MGNPPGERGIIKGSPPKEGDVKLPQLATAEREGSPVGVATTKTLVADECWELDALPAGGKPHVRAHQLVQRKRKLPPL